MAHHTEGHAPYWPECQCRVCLYTRELQRQQEVWNLLNMPQGLQTKLVFLLDSKGRVHRKFTTWNKCHHKFPRFPRGFHAVLKDPVTTGVPWNQVPRSVVPESEVHDLGYTVQSVNYLR